MKPYNLIEEFVEKHLDKMLQNYPNICKCEQCKADIMAIALNQIPPQYVTGTRNIDITKNMITAKYNDKIIKSVNNAIKQVLKNPRSSCKNIRTNIWLPPENIYIEETYKI